MLRRPLLALLAVLAAGAALPAVAAAGRGSGVRLAPVGTFDAPLYVAAAPGDRRRLYVVEQGGRIRIVRGGRTLSRPFLDLSAQVTAGGEQGLLSVAFPPDHQSTGRFYVYFTDRAQQQRVVEYRRSSPDRADPASARVVMQMADPEPNHNGGNMQFGPDGYLYVATGDGGGADDRHGPRGNAQNLGSLLGKLLRIDPRPASGAPYRVPPSNPFAGREGLRGEIYSYGLRNPWRFSFDRATGDLSIGDVGQDQVEELNFVRRGRGRGANFGWRPFEGRRRNIAGESAPNAVAPVLQHTHRAGWCSITGGYVVRDRGLRALRGRYVYGDFCKGQIRAARLRPQGARADRGLGLRTIDRLASFGEDARGRVYVVSLAGPVYRLAAG
jgi:glucose/arabinose dehydrogenase